VDPWRYRGKQSKNEMLLIRCLRSGVHYWPLPSIGIALLRNFGQIDIIDLEVVLSLHKTHTLAENERYTIEPTWSAAGFGEGGGR